MTLDTLKTFIRENAVAIVCLASILFSFTFVVHHNLNTKLFEQTIWQAEALLDGSLAVSADRFLRLDIVYTDDGKAYWPLGIFPAIAVLPFVALSEFLSIPLYQGYLLPFITLSVFLVAASLARKWKFNLIHSLFLGALFCLGSGYILLAFEPSTWYFSQSFGVLLLLLALNEWYGKRRLWLIGFFLALLVHTRYISALATAFFCLEIIAENISLRSKIQRVALLVIPVVIAGFLVLGLNQVRFNDPFDTGYSRSETEGTMKAAREEYGFFGPRNIINNVYWYFIATPTPFIDPDTLHLVPPYLEVNRNGYGFFYLSPFFLAIFLYFVWDRRTRNLWIVSTGILLILLTHFTTGYFTFGPRYMMDLFPLWYVLLLISLPNQQLTRRQIIFITCSILLNVALIVWSIPRIWHLA